MSGAVVFAGVAFVAFAPLDITGGVTVVFAMRSENVALACVLTGTVVGFAVVGVTGFACATTGAVVGFAGDFVVAVACAVFGAGVAGGVAVRGAVTVIA